MRSTKIHCHCNGMSMEGDWGWKGEWDTGKERSCERKINVLKIYLLELNSQLVVSVFFFCLLCL